MPDTVANSRKTPGHSALPLLRRRSRERRPSLLGPWRKSAKVAGAEIARAETREPRLREALSAFVYWCYRVGHEGLRVRERGSRLSVLTQRVPPQLREVFLASGFGTKFDSPKTDCLPDTPAEVRQSPDRSPSLCAEIYCAAAFGCSHGRVAPFSHMRFLWSHVSGSALGLASGANLAGALLQSLVNNKSRSIVFAFALGIERHCDCRSGQGGGYRYRRRRRHPGP